MILKTHKFVQCKKILENCIYTSLSQTEDINELQKKLYKIFSVVNTTLPWITPFTVNLARTEDHIEPWYYYPKDMSEMAVLVKQGNVFTAIWRDANQWSLNDEYYSDINIISNKLSEWLVLEKPQKLLNIKQLIEQDHWRFDLNNTPKLYKNAPDDRDEVISWDKNYILTGTTILNMRLITRDEWRNVCKREHWFEKKIIN